MGEIALQKTCMRCKADKPLSDYCKQSRRKDGLNPYCSKCRRLFHAEGRDRLRASGKLKERDAKCNARLRRPENYQRFLEAKNEARRGKRRPEAVKARMGEREITFCEALRTFKWSAAYDPTTRQSPKLKDQFEIATKHHTEGAMFCDLVRDRCRKWPKRGTARWQEMAPRRMVEAFLAEFPWKRAGLSEADRYRLRYAHDVEFNIYNRTRQRLKKMTVGRYGDLLRGALTRGGDSRKVKSDLGYTVKEFAAHIERQFTKGMTWEAFLSGDIHIDHIRPCSSFDLTERDQVIECWSLSNTRPMWAEDNRAKAASQDLLL